MYIPYPKNNKKAHCLLSAISPIKIPNGNLLIKLNKKNELKSKIDRDLEIKKQISFEQNRQLNSFSLNFYKKIKQNSTINEY